MTTLGVLLLCELEAIHSTVNLEAMQFNTIKNSAFVTTVTAPVTKYFMIII